MPDAERCEGEVTELFTLWNDALKTERAEVVASLYATNAVLVPTVRNDIRPDRARIRDYFTEFLKKKPTGVLTECNPRRYGPTLIANSGLYTFTFRADPANPIIAKARYTFVYEWVEDRWLIAQHHSSALAQEVMENRALLDMVF